VYNELYKIFKRKRTIIPFAVIAVLIIGLGWVTVKYLEPETKGWKADYTERTGLELNKVSMCENGNGGTSQSSRLGLWDIRSNCSFCPGLSHSIITVSYLFISQK